MGRPEALTDQLDHLMMMALLPNVTIQVIPFDCGRGGPTGPIVLLEFPDDDESSAAYLEYITGLVVVEDEDEIFALSVVWDDVASRALSADDSVRLIQERRNARTT